MTLSSRDSHILQGSIEALRYKDRSTWHSDTRAFQLTLEELCSGLKSVDLVLTKSLDPFTFVVLRSRRDEHRVSNCCCLAENDSETVRTARFL